MVMSSVVALESTMPRSRDGRGWEKRRKDSGVRVRSRVGKWVRNMDRYLHLGLGFHGRGGRGGLAGPLSGWGGGYGE